MSTHCHADNENLHEPVQGQAGREHHPRHVSLLPWFIFARNPSALSLVVRSSTLLLMSPSPVCIHLFKATIATE